MPSRAHDMPAAASVDPRVFALRPDYRALVIAITSLTGGPTDEASDAALSRAEESARDRLSAGSAETLPEVAAWREAFMAFGVKPRAARSSVEALLRRCTDGLPRIDRLTDLYNAISIEHLVPIGGEDLAAYVGAPRLVLADGLESFDTMVDGQPASATPDVGEVIWRDDIGVTCRRWNWRQCVRTRLGESTTDALFIIDALAPITDEQLDVAGQALIEAVCAGSDRAEVSTVVLSA